MMAGEGVRGTNSSAPATMKRESVMQFTTARSLILLPVLTMFPHSVLLAVYFSIFLAIAILVDTRKEIVTLMGLCLLVFITHFAEWDTRLSTWFYQHWYPGKKIEAVVYSRYTPYHKIDVLRREDGSLMLALNGKRQFSHGGHFNYSYFLAEYPSRLFHHRPHVALLGCGVMSTVGRIGALSQAITIVDIDREVFETSRRYFQRYNRLDSFDNWHFIADDAKHFMANTDQRFELILHDIPPAYSRQIALTYTREFFSQIRDRLTDDGVFSIASLSPMACSSSSAPSTSAESGTS